MLALLMLFRPAPRRQFVLLDAEQRCRVMRCARQCPAVGNWVEVSEFSLCWLGQPLPRGGRSVACGHTAAMVAGELKLSQG